MQNVTTNLWQWVHCEVNHDLLKKEGLLKLIQYHTLWVGFSGGLDSTVLLHYLASQPMLFGNLRAIHVHHGLSPNATAWQDHCQQFCEANHISLITRQVQIDSCSNVEECARKARYQVFSSLLESNDALLLGHHADDQAETLLLQLCRGAGVDGLAGMEEQKQFVHGMLLRPFLHHSRMKLKVYAEQHQLTWVEDESNQEDAFSRNYLRHHILPLLRKKWPGVAGNLARSALHCLEAKKNLEALAHMDFSPIGGYQDTLSLEFFNCFSGERQVNLLRGWLKYHRVRCPSTVVLYQMINNLIKAKQDAVPSITWDNHLIRRYHNQLYCLRVATVLYPSASIEWSVFPEPLILTEDFVFSLEAIHSNFGVIIPQGCCVSVSYRQGGELFYWHGQKKQLKKLFQQWKVPPWLRSQIPLVYVNDELAVVVGYAISDHYYGTKEDCTYQIKQQCMSLIENSES